MENKTEEAGELDNVEYIFDRMYVRLIFIGLYTIVFCFCFFGNLIVILVVTLHWRMRNITKFCLANLAVADLCVGVFCVYQNLSTYLISSWILGEFMCKMYHFINGLSHTSSILIIVVMCVERYLAILHPLRCSQILTLTRLRIIMVGVWLCSAIYCAPKFYYIATVTTHRNDGTEEIICTAKRTLYNSKTFDMVHFSLLFLLPLFIITILYTRVGITLWHSGAKRRRNLNYPASFRAGTVNSGALNIALSHIQDSSYCNGSDNLDHRTEGSTSFNSCQTDEVSRTVSPQMSSSSSSSNCSRKSGSGRTRDPGKVRRTSIVSTKPTTEINEVFTSSGKRNSSESEVLPGTPMNGKSGLKNQNDVQKENNNVDRSQRSDGRPGSIGSRSYGGRRPALVRQNCRRRIGPLRSRQSVVKMLIAIVVTFFLCNLPFHVRKVCQYWWPNYDYVSVFNALFTPLTHLIMYANCAINPIIYAFMSKTFRSSLLELMRFRWKKPSISSNYLDHPTLSTSFRSTRHLSRAQ